MAERLFGMEAELAVSGRRGPTILPAPIVVSRLGVIAHRTLTALAGGTNRLYLQNGGVFYVDAGDHPEYATPECTTPAEVVSHLHAGQRIVERLARAAGEELKADAVDVSRANVDYAGNTTWGCHESYLGNRPLAAYPEWLVPHLVSRIVFTGAGGIDPRTPGIRFSLSPRVGFITHALSTNSVAHRGIFHLRDEPLAREHTRIHVLAGDNACSQRATWLKIATTALVVALADASRRRYDWVKVLDPVETFASFARDRAHRARVVVRGGCEATMTALEMQRHLLARVEANLDAETMPAWAGDACRAWRAALDLVASDAIAHSHALDWPLKFALFQREIARRGLTPEQVETWSNALERALQPRGPSTSSLLAPNLVDKVRIDALQARGAITAEDMAAATQSLASRGLSWDDLPAFVDLRRHLCVMDLRFGEMTTGIFDSLDRAGLVPDHHAVPDGSIEDAEVHPPPATRAAARGFWVRKLAKEPGRFHCDWSGILARGARLALDDPFDTQGKWVSEGTEDLVPEMWGRVPF